MRFREALDWFMLPGVVLHELAHALVVVLLPNVTLTDVDLTSHVEHRGHYTILTSTLIAYAPLLVNTAVALLALSYVSELGAASLRDVVVSALLAYVAFAAGMAAIPSWTDVTNPLAVSWRQLFSIRGLPVVPFMLVLLVLSVPFLVISYARGKSVVTYVLVSAVYAIGVVLVAFGVIQIPSVESTVELGRVLVENVVEKA